MDKLIFCFDCNKDRLEDKLNVKCNDCKRLICDDCLDGDLLHGMKCRHCCILWLKRNIIRMQESITFMHLELRELENDNFSEETLQDDILNHSTDSE